MSKEVLFYKFSLYRNKLSRIDSDTAYICIAVHFPILLETVTEEWAIYFI